MNTKPAATAERPPHPWRWASLGCLLLLSACTAPAPQPPAHPVDLPERFLAGAPQADPPQDHWWHDFADERLSSLIDQAVLHNPAVGQSLARQQMARAQARISRADQLPQVGAGLSANRQRQILSMPGSDDTAFIGNNFSLSLDINWELDLWGRLSAQSAAARADLLASSEQLRALRQSIAAQAARLYFQVAEAQAQLALSERTVEVLSEVARQLDNRASAGIAPPIDNKLANANLESARAGLEQRQGELARATRQLEILLGDYPAGRVTTASGLPDIPPSPPAGLPADLLLRRPDVLVAEWSLHSAGYQLTAAKRSFLPAISLTGSAGSVSSDFGDLLDSGTFIWSIAGRALQPLFQGGRLRAQVELREGQRDEALEAYAETVLQALSEVETALALEAFLTMQENALDAAASAAEEAVQVSYNRYMQGIDPFLSVLESHQRALDGRSAQIAARYARLNNRINLHLALGGGFEPETQMAIHHSGSAP